MKNQTVKMVVKASPTILKSQIASCVTYTWMKLLWVLL